MNYQEVLNNLVSKNYSWDKFDLKSGQLKNVLSLSESDGITIKEIYYTNNTDKLKRNNLAMVCRGATTQYDPEYEETITGVPVYFLILVIEYNKNSVIKEDSIIKIGEQEILKSKKQYYIYSSDHSLRDLFFTAKEKEMKIDVLLDGFLDFED